MEMGGLLKETAADADATLNEFGRAIAREVNRDPPRLNLRARIP